MLALRAPLVERVPSRVPFRARSRLVVRRVSASGASGASDGSAPRRPSIRAPPPADPTTGVPRSLFCFGLGYTSLGLVNVLKRAGWTVSGTCRDDSRAESLASAGIDAHVWRPDDHLRLDRDGVAALAAATHVLASVPPVADFDRDPVLTDARCVDVLARSENLRWLGYLSSTGVYGDKLGAWVDEDEPAVEMVFDVVHVYLLHGCGGDVSAAGDAHDGAGARAHGAGRDGSGKGEGSGGSGHARR